MEVHCKRIAHGIEDEDFSMSCAGTSDETPIVVPSYEEAMSRLQDCPGCVFSHEM